jgi:hypothetical protein
MVMESAWDLSITVQSSLTVLLIFSGSESKASSSSPAGGGKSLLFSA